MNYGRQNEPLDRNQCVRLHLECVTYLVEPPGGMLPRRETVEAQASSSWGRPSLWRPPSFTSSFSCGQALEMVECMCIKYFACIFREDSPNLEDQSDGSLSCADEMAFISTVKLVMSASLITVELISFFTFLNQIGFDHFVLKPKDCKMNVSTHLKFFDEHQVPLCVHTLPCLLSDTSWTTPCFVAFSNHRQNCFAESPR